MTKECPCKTCISFAVCINRFKPFRDSFTMNTIKCSIIDKYLNNKLEVEEFYLRCKEIEKLYKNRC